MTVRAYDHLSDYESVGDFQVDIYRPGRGLRTWQQVKTLD